MEWSEDFERFLAEGKRILTGKTMDYYRNLFRRHLEGRELAA
ncbi:MAG: hypothetical protein ACP5L2_08100 [Conexivisphaera sp.]